MSKELKKRLDKLENELKESKKEIHKLKGSLTFIVENNIKRFLSRFTRKQIVFGSLIVLFSVSIIGIAGTVTKNYTFSAGELVSAAKFNANFDTLYTLVNGNLDDSNTSGISASKITSGVLDNSTIPKPADHITIFVTPPFYNGNLGGRTGADSKCFNHLDNETVILVNNSCKNVKAVISVDSSDSIRTMVANYNISTNKLLRTRTGKIFTKSFDNLTEDKNGEPQVEISIDGALGPLGEGGNDAMYWTGSSSNGNWYNGKACSNWTSSSNSLTGNLGRSNKYDKNMINGGSSTCDEKFRLLCICF
tara:strand:- start:2505 stop:3422 length:918 start_codon:yes stop_codon:yes gene_type:complete